MHTAGHALTGASPTTSCLATKCGWDLRPRAIWAQETTDGGEATPDSLLCIHCRTSLGQFSNLRSIDCTTSFLSRVVGEFCELGPLFALAAGSMHKTVLFQH